MRVRLFDIIRERERRVFMDLHVNLCECCYYSPRVLAKAICFLSMF